MNRQRRKRRRRRKLLRLIACYCFLLMVVFTGSVTITCVAKASSSFFHSDRISLSDTISVASTEKTLDSKQEDSDWSLILANPWNPLPSDFTVALADLGLGHSIDKRASEDTQDMLRNARSEGLNPVICSSFRTQEKQQALFDAKVLTYTSQGYSEEDAKTAAAKWVAVPGTSEHQTGLALDIVASSYQILDEKQETTAEQLWLMKNSWKYGFILRYPEDKSALTGINYEPWHYRYVGKEAAKEIYEQGICLEEYLKTN